MNGWDRRTLDNYNANLYTPCGNNKTFIWCCVSIKRKYGLLVHFANIYIVWKYPKPLLRTKKDIKLSNLRSLCSIFNDHWMKRQYHDIFLSYFQWKPIFIVPFSMESPWNMVYKDFNHTHKACLFKVFSRPGGYFSFCGQIEIKYFYLAR